MSEPRRPAAFFASDVERACGAVLNEAEGHDFVEFLGAVIAELRRDLNAKVELDEKEFDREAGE